MANTFSALSASTLIGDSVKNTEGEDLGKIEEIMIDVDHGRIAYAVLSFGGFLGIGNKLFAVPWGTMTLDVEDEAFVVDIDKETLEEAPGFDKDNWPSAVQQDHTWLLGVYEFYHRQPYW